MIPVRHHALRLYLTDPNPVIDVLLCPQCDESDEFTVWMVQGHVFLHCILCDLVIETLMPSRAVKAAVARTTAAARRRPIPAPSPRRCLLSPKPLKERAMSRNIARRAVTSIAAALLAISSLAGLAALTATSASAATTWHAFAVTGNGGLLVTAEPLHAGQVITRTGVAYRVVFTHPEGTGHETFRTVPAAPGGGTYSARS